jgi:bifunctional DNase/RNase
MREVQIYGVSFDMVGKQPIVLLKTIDDNRYLPIWIGHPEAAAILMKLQGADTPRPMTHDLMIDILDQVETKVERISVNELRDNTFFATITLSVSGTEIEIDSRPSDAIAIAVRADAKIFATDEVIEESGIEFEGDDEEAEARIARVSELADLDPAEFRRFLDTVTPDQFAEQVEEQVEGEDDEESRES